MAGVPRIRQVVDFHEDDYQLLSELAEYLDIGRPAVIRRAIRELHEREMATTVKKGK